MLKANKGLGDLFMFVEEEERVGLSEDADTLRQQWDTLRENGDVKVLQARLIARVLEQDVEKSATDTVEIAFVAHLKSFVVRFIFNERVRGILVGEHLSGRRA